MEKNISNKNRALIFAKYIALTFILVLCLLSYGQKKTNYSSWDKLEYMTAATATNNTELTSFEQETYYYINLVRMNAPLFANTYLKDFYEINKANEDKYKSYKTVLRELSMSKRMPVITPLMCNRKNETISLALKKSSPKELVAQLLCNPSKQAKQMRKLLFDNDTYFAKIQIAESRNELFLFVTGCVEEDYKKRPNNYSSSNKYYIIAGSFSNKNVADERVTELQKKGYKNTKILYDNSFFQVTIDGYPTLLEAQAKAYQLPFQVWIKYLTRKPNVN